MKYSFDTINNILDKKGYFVIKNFVEDQDIDKNFLTYLKKKKNKKKKK